MIWTLLGNRYVIIGGILCALLGGAYLFYSSATAKIERLEADNKRIQTELDTQKAANNQLKADSNLIIASHKAHVERATKIAVQSQKKYETLYRENENKKSLEELAEKKPGLISGLVNEATKKQFQCFESISLGQKCEN